MRPVARHLVVALVGACGRSPAGPVEAAAGPSETSIVAGEGTGAGAAPVVVAAPGEGEPDAAAALAPDEGLTRVEPLRPGPDAVDRALLLRLRRHADAAVKIEALVRSGDAWLVAYTYDEIEAWWREVHRTGEADEVRAALRRRRLECEAAHRHPAEAETAGADEFVDDFDPGADDAMDTRTCWERALGSLAPREGPLEGECLALAVARVTDAAVEVLWTDASGCVAPPDTFELVDVAGAGWPQLVLRVHETRWDMTRLGFQEADTTARLVVLDPRSATEPEMLEVIERYETHVDEGWHWEGSYAHVTVARGRHVTVLEQKWRTTDACEVDAAGWAVADLGEEGDTDDVGGADERCAVEWIVTRTPWDPATQRWSGAPEELPRPKRLPVRDGGLSLTSPRAGKARP